MTHIGKREQETQTQDHIIAIFVVNWDAAAERPAPWPLAASRASSPNIQTRIECSHESSAS